MQEAFEKAFKEQPGSEPHVAQTKITILRAQYRSLGVRLFRQGVLGRGFRHGRRWIEFSGEEDLIDECHRLHPDLIQWPEETRASILSGYTDGLNISETRLHPVYQKYLEYRDILPGYTHAAQVFQICLAVNYHLSEAIRQEFYDCVDHFMGYQKGRTAINLLQTRLAAGNWLGTLQL